MAILKKNNYINILFSDNKLNITSLSKTAVVKIFDVISHSIATKEITKEIKNDIIDTMKAIKDNITSDIEPININNMNLHVYNHHKIRGQCTLIIDGIFWNMDIDKIVELYNIHGFFGITQYLDGEFIIIVFERYDNGTIRYGSISDFMGTRGIYCSKHMELVSTYYDSIDVIRLGPCMYNIVEYGLEKTIVSKSKYYNISDFTYNKNKKYKNVLEDVILKRIGYIDIKQYYISILTSDINKYVLYSKLFLDIFNKLNIKYVIIDVHEDNNYVFSMKGCDVFFDHKNNKSAKIPFTKIDESFDHNQKNITYPYLDKELVMLLYSIPLHNRTYAYVIDPK